MRIGVVGFGFAAALPKVARVERSAAWDGLIWLGVIVLAVMAGAVVLLWFRRRVKRRDDRVGPAFSVEELRELRARGELSDEEFELLKRKTLNGF